MPSGALWQGWIPRSQNDFGDGGAFPEIHVAQYPMGMGHKDNKQTSSVVPLSIGADGKVPAARLQALRRRPESPRLRQVKYDAIINQHRDKDVTVYSTPADLLAKRDAREEYAKPDEEEERRTAIRTQEALEKIVGVKIAAGQPNSTKACRPPLPLRRTSDDRMPPLLSGRCAYVLLGDGR